MKVIKYYKNGKWHKASGSSIINKYVKDAYIDESGLLNIVKRNNGKEETIKFRGSGESGSIEIVKSIGTFVDVSTVQGQLTKKDLIKLKNPATIISLSAITPETWNFKKIALTSIHYSEVLVEDATGAHTIRCYSTITDGIISEIYIDMSNGQWLAEAEKGNTDILKNYINYTDAYAFVEKDIIYRSAYYCNTVDSYGVTRITDVSEIEYWSFYYLEESGVESGNGRYFRGDQYNYEEIEVTKLDHIPTKEEFTIEDLDKYFINTKDLSLIYTPGFSYDEKRLSKASEVSGTGNNKWKTLTIDGVTKAIGGAESGGIEVAEATATFISEEFAYGQFESGELAKIKASDTTMILIHAETPSFGINLKFAGTQFAEKTTEDGKIYRAYLSMEDSQLVEVDLEVDNGYFRFRVLGNTLLLSDYKYESGGIYNFGNDLSTTGYRCNHIIVNHAKFIKSWSELVADGLYYLEESGIEPGYGLYIEKRGEYIVYLDIEYMDHVPEPWEITYSKEWASKSIVNRNTPLLVYKPHFIGIRKYLSRMPEITGTDDGVNWKTININGKIRNIPQGGGKEPDEKTVFTNEDGKLSTTVGGSYIDKIDSVIESHSFCAIEDGYHISCGTPTVDILSYNKVSTVSVTIYYSDGTTKELDLPTEADITDRVISTGENVKGAEYEMPFEFGKDGKLYFGVYASPITGEEVIGFISNSLLRGDIENVEIKEASLHKKVVEQLKSAEVIPHDESLEVDGGGKLKVVTKLDYEPAEEKGKITFTLNHLQVRHFTKEDPEIGEKISFQLIARDGYGDAAVDTVSIEDPTSAPDFLFEAEARTASFTYIGKAVHIIASATKYVK